jgi:SAM-dependent methyltransferase
MNRFRAAMTAFLDPARISADDRSDQLLRRIERLEALQEPTGRTAEVLLSRLDNRHKVSPNRVSRIMTIARKALSDAGLSSGTMLEIGGRANPCHKEFPGFSYSALDIAEQPDSPVPVTVADITDCPHIADDSLDFVFSLDVFEHIDKPWRAASEITRILRPGGVTMHSTLFAWRYHPCPIDYWRFSAEGLKSLFPALECLHSGFDYTERRRNILGQGNNRIESDEIGGWRENVRVNYAGVKPKAG